MTGFGGGLNFAGSPSLDLRCPTEKERFPLTDKFGYNVAGNKLFSFHDPFCITAKQLCATSFVLQFLKKKRSS